MQGCRARALSWQPRASGLGLSCRAGGECWQLGTLVLPSGPIRPVFVVACWGHAGQSDTEEG